MRCNCHGREYQLKATGYILCIECGKQFKKSIEKNGYRMDEK